MSTPIHPDAIREQVRDYYGGRARAAAGEQACCDSSCGCGGDSTAQVSCGQGYPAEALQELPAELTGFSLGCANPVSPAGLQPGETVLDLGSGGGLDCALASRAVGPSGRVIGVDMTEAMLERARANAARAGLDNVEFRGGLIEDLPVEAGSVDVVISNCVINLSPDKPAVMREIARVLRPGGRVSLADIVTHGPLAPALRSLADGWAACVSGAIEAEAYAGALREAGLSEVHLTPADGRALEEIPQGQPFSALVTARKP